MINTSTTNLISPILSVTPAIDAWRIAPEHLRLQKTEAHVWLANLDEENAAEFDRLLSADEQVRAERFRFAQDRKRFVAARGFLRVILGKYLQTDPRSIRFQYNEYGKPSLTGQFPSSIKFNLSHSDETAIYAFTIDREIGVDVERIKPSFIDEGMLSYCLTAREISRFRELSESEGELFFFDCWTLKEAYLKLYGKGLSLPANQIETALFIESSNGLFENETQPRQQRPAFPELPSIPGCAAALAIEGDKPHIKFWL